MQEEQRDTFFNTELGLTETCDTQSRSLKSCSKTSYSDIRSKTGHLYVKKSANSGTSVSNCSARPLQISLQPKGKSSSMRASRSQPPEIKVNPRQSFSIADPPQRFFRCHPSASFEEAIERGYISDQMNRTSDVSEDELPGPGCSRTKVKDKMSPLTSSRLSISSGPSVSIFDDKVIIDEDGVESMYNNYGETTLPDTSILKQSNYYKTLSTSECNLTHAQKIKNVKLTTVSFDSRTRRASVELTKDKLFLHDADDRMPGAGDCSDSDTEQLPEELFTEVNERTLAYLKRHGSSLNVAPSAESSPVTVQRSRKFQK